MYTVPSSIPPSPGLQSFLKPREQPSASILTRVNAETRTHADIAILTAEGDKVTFSASTVLQAVYASYDARGRVEGQGLDVHADASQLAASRDTAITVAGKLNDEELADINHLLENFGTIVTDFLAGNLDEAVTRALDLGNLDTLASFEASFEQVQHVRVEQQYTAQGSLRDTPASTENPGPSAQISPRSIQRLLERMLQAAEKSQVDPETLVQELPQFTDKLMQKLVNQPGVDAPKTKLAEHLLANFASNLEEMAAAEHA